MLFVRISVLACACLCLGQGAPPRHLPVATPQAVVTNAGVNYCFARVRGNDPSRMPPAYLVMQLRVQVTYHNEGTRPSILPLQSERALFTAFMPGMMKKFPPPPGLYEPGTRLMKVLPADVSPENPIQPKNDVFTVIPAGGEMTPALVEDFILAITCHKPQDGLQNLSRSARPQSILPAAVRTPEAGSRARCRFVRPVVSLWRSLDRHARNQRTHNRRSGRSARNTV